MAAAATLPLAGRGIVLTRPAAQACRLSALIQARGGRAILFPVIEIADVQDRRPLEAVIDRLEMFDLAIFISPTAAVKGVEAIRARRTFPERLQIAAVGRGSARELQRLGLSRVSAPADGADSESLLGMPELRDVAGRRIVIFRGVGGRELLRETLVARGAHVEYAECYRRIRPNSNVPALLRRWRAGEIDALVVTSGDGLRNLHEMLGHEAHANLAATPIFVPHSRIASAANELNLTNVIVTDTGDEAIVSSLVQHFAEV